MKRTSCIVCRSNDLTKIYSIPNYPIQMWNTLEPCDTDILHT